MSETLRAVKDEEMIAGKELGVATHNVPVRHFPMNDDWPSP